MIRKKHLTADQELALVNRAKGGDSLFEAHESIKYQRIGPALIENFMEG